MLRKLYYKIFPTYEVLETKFITYAEAGKLIDDTQDQSEENKWVLSSLEDHNSTIGMVYICRKIRIWN